MRKTVLLMDDWFFTYKNEEKVKVDLPHTWNNFDGQDGGNDYYRGTCLYEKKLTCPIFDKEKEVVYLQFHGVNASAKVNLNGKEVISHDGGYSTFRVDVTDILQETNELKVEVDNSVNDRVYPQRADFTFWGGIYREVEWLIVSKNHFDLDYYGGTGLKYETSIDGKNAKVHVTSYTNNEDSKVVISLFDKDGNLVDEQNGNFLPHIQKIFHLLIHH